MSYCLCCDYEDVVVSRVDVAAIEFGLPSGILSSVEEIRCPRCGDVSRSIAAHGAVISEYRKNLAQVSRPLTPAEFTYLRRSLGATGKGYAEAMGISNVTVSRVENGGAVPPHQDALIRAMTLLDFYSLDALGQMTARASADVRIDVADVERRLPQEISDGWQPLPEQNLGSNVVVLRRPARAGRPLEQVEFECDEQEAFCGMRACQ